MVYTGGMYEIQILEGYVLDYYNQGEADRRYQIVTSDYGVIEAQATSVRKEQSKLQSFLQKLNLLELEIIQARRGYQITGARLIRSLSQDYNFSQLAALSRLAEVITRLAYGQDGESQLFALFTEIASQLESQREQIPVVETWGRARIVMEYGYFDPAFSENIPREIFSLTELDPSTLRILEQYSGELEGYTRQCLDQTML